MFLILSVRKKVTRFAENTGSSFPFVAQGFAAFARPAGLREQSRLLVAVGGVRNRDLGSFWFVPQNSFAARRVPWFWQTGHPSMNSTASAWSLFDYLVTR
ncbi:MAG: hypothetical protein DMG57_18865 [Acidobacteria bacterium]|nr:MAG: hypothetical protein DMG57_18865 [Acidobacteriota bacterium]